MPYDFSELKVLIAEDNQYMRGVIREILRSFSFEREHIREVPSGAAAIEALRYSPVDFMITDLRMTPVNGLRLMRWVRRHEDSPNPHLPIIVCTGYTDPQHVEAARDAGANEILAKPISALACYDHIRTLIEAPRSFAEAEDYFGPDRRRREIHEYKPKRESGQSA